MAEAQPEAFSTGQRLERKTFRRLKKKKKGGERLSPLHCCSATKLDLTLLQPCGLNTGILRPWGPPGKNTGALPPPGILPTQGLDLCLLHQQAPFTPEPTGKPQFLLSVVALRACVSLYRIAK